MPPLAKLVVKVEADTADVKVAFAQLNVQINNITQNFTRITNNLQSQQKAATSWGVSLSSAIYNVKSAFSLLSNVVGGFIGFMQGAVKISSEYNNSIVALIGTSRAYGLDSDKVLAATRHLTDDGLLPLGNAAKSVRNLLATGFDLKQSVDIMNAFKDSATNARQSTYSFADAIVTATEGLKNTRSVQVDNVGITKNLSVIMKEYGFVMADITDKTKGLAARQALHNGLMREAAAQAGDAARSLNTYSGAMTALDSGYKSLQAQIGDNITRSQSFQIVIKEIAGWILKLTDYLVHNKQGFLLVSDALEVIIRTSAAVIRAIDAMHTAFTALDSMIRQMMAGLGKVVSETLFPINRMLATMASKTPGGEAGLEGIFKVPEGTIAAMREAAAAADEMMDGAQKHIEANNASVKTWGNTLGTAASSLDNLADRVHTLRGNVIDLSASARAAGDVIDKNLGPDVGKDAFKAFRKSLTQLELEIRTAVAQGEPLSLLLELFGQKAYTAATKAEAFGIKAGDAVGYVGEEFRQAKIDKTMDKADDAFQKFFDKRYEKKFDILQAGMHDTAIEAYDLFKTLKSPGTLSQFDKFFSDRMKKNFDQAANTLHQRTPQLVAELSNPFLTAFGRLGTQLPELLQRGFQKGGMEGIIEVVAIGAGNQFEKVFLEGAERVRKDTTGLAKLTGKEFGAGMAAAALNNFVTGFSTGLAGESMAGLLTSVIGGGVSGFLTAGPVGAAVGIGTGLAGYLLGVQKNKQVELDNVKNAQAALITQFHGMEALQKKFDTVGFQFRLRGQDPLTATTQEQFNQRIQKMNAALDAYNEKLKAIAESTTAVNKRTEIFGGQFAPLVAAKKEAKDKGDTDAEKAASEKIQALAQVTQPEFERLGLFVQNVFAAMVKETGDAVSALTALAPSFQVLKSGISDFGLTSTATIDQLLKDFNLVNDEAFKPLFEQIAATGKLFTSLDAAHLLLPATFQAAAADIGQSIQLIIDKGGDMATTYALSAPQLQALWEAQQTYGKITDETTQKILQQAEQQGIVGEQFRSVNDKILEVLLAIADVFGAKIPDSMRRTQDAATETGKVVKRTVGGAIDDLPGAAKRAAAGVSNELAGIHAPKLEVPVRIKVDKSEWDDFTPRDSQGNPIPFDWDSSDSSGGAVPRLARGAIVRRPTLALVGEAGPEIVAPLPQFRKAMSDGGGEAPSSVVFGPGSVVINGDIDTAERADRIVRDFAKSIMRNGRTRTLALRSLGMERV